MTADWLQDLLQEVRRNPPHPGETIRHDCLGSRLGTRAAARLLGVPSPDLRRVLDGRAPVTPGLARRLEAQGWSNAPFWLRLQDAYDRAQQRRRLEAQSAA